MKHHTEIKHLGEGQVQAVCSCGWASPIYGENKSLGTMNALQQAEDARDLHEWDLSLSD